MSVPSATASSSSAAAEASAMIQRPCAVCKTPATQSCAICKVLSYCCKDHQKQHWPQHKNVCHILAAPNEHLDDSQLASQVLVYLKMSNLKDPFKPENVDVFLEKGRALVEALKTQVEKDRKIQLALTVKQHGALVLQSYYKEDADQILAEFNEIMFTKVTVLGKLKAFVDNLSALKNDLENKRNV